MIKTFEAKVGQFIFGCKCPVSQGIVVQEQDHFGDLPWRFSFKMSFCCTSRDKWYSASIVWSLEDNQ